MHIIFTFLLILCCIQQNKAKTDIEKIGFTEADILNRLDLAFKGQPAEDYPSADTADVRYNFFLDLEHGYFETAGSKIHLYADSARWAIVFEKSGYQNRGVNAAIELNYVGNCIKYPIEKHPDRKYITNTSNIILINSEEYDRIGNKDENNSEDFEFVSAKAKEVTVHGQKTLIEQDISKYRALGIISGDGNNSQKLIGFGDLIGYFNETNPKLVSAMESEIKQHISMDIPKIVTLEKFHFSSIYDQNNLPSSQETYQLIAKILTKQKSELWKPTQKPNNHWKNWKSGHL